LKKTLNKDSNISLNLSPHTLARLSGKTRYFLTYVDFKSTRAAFLFNCQIGLYCTAGCSFLFYFMIIWFFLNLNILASPIYIAATVVGALIPDIDYTKFMIGKIFRPISKYLNRRFGHRTITHSDSCNAWKLFVMCLYI